MNGIIGARDILWVTLDTLRFDVADRAMAEGRTPNFAKLLPNGWERRHTPGSFTLSAHAAFFAGFLPTPAGPGPHPRLFASRFEGSETTAPQTWVHDAAHVPGGLADAGYHTACIGGVGFFNKRTELGRVFPGMFHESHWEPRFGVTDPDSTRHQVGKACEIIGALDGTQRLFLFLNVSALHQPNCIFADGAHEDSPATMETALSYVDAQLPPLLDALRERGPAFCIFMSDHGTCYGEDGYTGHRLAHPAVWEVPYGEAVLD
ncbi:MAG: STM4013/SEN3800 family hydrolase [Planctomycetes bacterium]|nr:STM4013/SEN3800 family hydrolase [Planctomycetota bacterium]